MSVTRAVRIRLETLESGERTVYLYVLGLWCWCVVRKDSPHSQRFNCGFMSWTFR